MQLRTILEARNSPLCSKCGTKSLRIKQYHTQITVDKETGFKVFLFGSRHAVVLRDVLELECPTCKYYEFIRPSDSKSEAEHHD